MKAVKPFHILLFTILVMLALASVSYFFPTEGITVFGQKISFPNLLTYFSAKENEKTDISKIVALADAEDKLTDEDTLKSSTDSIAKKAINYTEVNDPAIKLITSIQYKDSAKTALCNFFESLAAVQSDNKSIRILHYGDSQIEGDRITDYLRQKLQNHFGGKGCGFIAAMPVTQSVGIRQSWSDTWDRYSIFTAKDSRVSHSNYGVAAGFCRYCNYNDTATIKNAWLKIKTTQGAGSLVASYNKVKMFYASTRKKTQIDFFENDVLRKTDTLSTRGNFNITQFNLSQIPNTFEIKFQGKDSPDIFGLSLEGDGGVMVDNFGLRGSSGTFFNQMNLQHLKLFYDYMNTKFIILQFGGNTMPNILDKTMAANFGDFLRAQINSIRKIAPNVSILVVGPADMSIKDGDTYVTYPLLEDVRDAIRLAAFQTNCAFFDMYDCMGGKNSMISWVDQGIAATDYIHFSPAGARKIAVLLYSALMNDYNNFIQKKNNKNL
ncbi:MAG TPA: GDSL-type esterase/lipase family protein [Bacteroidia bacterium]|nr:GDSL-type esterase/lipase family protein [Bacteroidia bacterium]